MRLAASRASDSNYGFPQRLPRTGLHRALCALVLFVQIIAVAPSVSAQVGTIDAVLPRMVKIFGAGGIRNLEAFSTGFLISPDGHVATIWNHVLDVHPEQGVTAILDDGRRYRAHLVGAEPQLNLAVLKLAPDETGLPHVNPARAVNVAPGTRVLAFSNMFRVSTGDEPVSVLHGVIAARTNLAVRRGAFEVPYGGDVYIIDAVTNNPGAGGGLITTLDGRPVAMIGRELQNDESNTWINYAIPVTELSPVIAEIISGRYTAKNRVDDGDTSPAQFRTEDVGLVMVPDVVARTPAWVEAVLLDSPANRAGIRADDLVLFLDDQLIQSCDMFRKTIGRLESGDMFRLVLRRGDELVTVDLLAPPTKR